MDTDINSHANETVMESFAKIPFLWAMSKNGITRYLSGPGAYRNTRATESVVDHI